MSDLINYDRLREMAEELDRPLKTLKDMLRAKRWIPGRG
jgi:hypothetical protein